MAFCTHCGSVLAGTFCSGCGRPRGQDPGRLPGPDPDDGWAVARRSGPPRVGLAIVMTALVLVLGGVAAWAGVGPGFGAHGRTTPTRTSATQPRTDLAPPPTPESPPPTTVPPPSPAPELPDPGMVTLAASAATNPAAIAVQHLFERHFGAINAHDYDAWTTTVTGERSSAIPRQEWLRGYRSTRDELVQVTNIRTNGSDEILVDLTFVSTQDPDDAPTDLAVGKICWSTELPVGNLSGGGQIGKAIAGSTTKSAC